MSEQQEVRGYWKARQGRGTLGGRLVCSQGEAGVHLGGRGGGGGNRNHHLTQPRVTARGGLRCTWGGGGGGARHIWGGGGAHSRGGGGGCTRGGLGHTPNAPSASRPPLPL